MLLVDPPPTWTTPADAAARTRLASLTSGNAALYFPLVVIRDPLADGYPMPTEAKACTQPAAALTTLSPRAVS